VAIRSMSRRLPDAASCQKRDGVRVEDLSIAARAAKPCRKIVRGIIRAQRIDRQAARHSRVQGSVAA
jgi:hypothetical protein